MNKLIVAGGLSVVLCGATAATAGPEEDCVQGFAFTLENDYFGLDNSNSDRWYTTGIQAAWSYRKECRGSTVDLIKELGRWRQWVLPPGWLAQRPQEQPSVIFSVVHNWYTPQNIYGEPADQRGDRPYAGYVVGSAGTSTFLQGNRHEAIDFKLGLIGPSAMAEEVQSGFHKHILHKREPKGWENQLRPRVAVQANYALTQRWNGSDSLKWAGWQWFGRASVGRPRTQVATGVTLLGGVRDRVVGSPDEGDHVGVDFTDRKNHFPEWLQWLSFYVQGQLAAVAYNQFIDGTTFGPQPEIRRRPFVAIGTVGMNFRVHPSVSIELRNTWRTPDFEPPADSNKSRLQNYGAIRVLIDTAH